MGSYQFSEIDYINWKYRRYR